MIPILASAGGRFPRAGIAAAALVAAAGASAADIQKGGNIYSTHCAACHGATGTPVLPGAPNFRRLESLMRSDMQLLQSIRTGRGAMPGYYGVLRDREILDVVAFLRTLS